MKSYKNTSVDLYQSVKRHFSFILFTFFSKNANLDTSKKIKNERKCQKVAQCMCTFIFWKDATRQRADLEQILFEI